MFLNDHLKEMERFLKYHELPKHSRREIDRLKRHRAIKEIEFVKFKMLLKKKSASDHFPGEFFQRLKRVNINFTSSFPETRRRGSTSQLTC